MSVYQGLPFHTKLSLFLSTVQIASALHSDKHYFIPSLPLRLP
jgi:hypothetical protein